MDGTQTRINILANQYRERERQCSNKQQLQPWFNRREKDCSASVFVFLQ